jgi:hypothetical protein
MTKLEVAFAEMKNTTWVSSLENRQMKLDLGLLTR